MLPSDGRSGDRVDTPRLGEPQRAVGAGDDLAGLPQQRRRGLGHVAGRRDAADARQQALLGEPEVAVRAGGDVAGAFPGREAR